MKTPSTKIFSDEYKKQIYLLIDNVWQGSSKNKCPIWFYEIFKMRLNNLYNFVYSADTKTVVLPDFIDGYSFVFSKQLGLDCQDFMLSMENNFNEKSYIENSDKILEEKIKLFLDSKILDDEPIFYINIKEIKILIFETL